jgi:hypothetical protein
MTPPLWLVVPVLPIRARLRARDPLYRLHGRHLWRDPAWPSPGTTPSASLSGPATYAAPLDCEPR